MTDAKSFRLKNRREAGRLLAAKLSTLHGADAVVLALPRGGVPVAAEIAAALDAPLDLLFVRKIAAPWQPEVALGAVTRGEHIEIIWNEAAVHASGLRQEQLRALVAKELVEIERQQSVFGLALPASVRGRVAILVDDGAATGATAEVALRLLKAMRPALVVVAMPVLPPETAMLLQGAADALVCLATPGDFECVGQYYEDFEQVCDQDVRRVLHPEGAVAETVGSR